MIHSRFTLTVQLYHPLKYTIVARFFLSFSGADIADISRERYQSAKQWLGYLVASAGHTTQPVRRQQLKQAYERGQESYVLVVAVAVFAGAAVVVAVLLLLLLRLLLLNGL